MFVPGGATAAVDVRGGGPGTRETDALAPYNLVDRIHAVCLTGGSAYGLSAADGVMAELERRRLGVDVGPQRDHVVPVVPAAVIFDLGRGARFGNRPGPEFGERAVRAAKRSTLRGSIGAGTGARAGFLQGGVGMAAVAVDTGHRPVTVAALAVVNASGSTIDPSTGLPWIGGHGLRRPSTGDRRRLRDHLEAGRAEATSPLNTTIGVVATDAGLTRPEAQRLAMAAHDGLARAIRPAHLLVDGDTVFALATGGLGLPDDRRTHHLNTLLEAAADVFGRACVDAVVHAAAVGDDPAYADLCPSAFGR